MFTHVLDREELTVTLFLGGGKSFQERGSKGRVGVSLRRGGDYVVDLLGIPVVQLRYDMVEFCRLVGDAGERKLSFGL
jgi:hypothetical protein